MLRNLITVESGRPDRTPALPCAPARAVQRTYPGVPQRETSIELEQLRRKPSAPQPAQAPSAAGTPNDADVDLEMSRPQTPLNTSDLASMVQAHDGSDDGVEALQSIWDPHMNRYRFLAICLMNFTNGLNDSAPGALIPYMETHYNIGYALVSLIFVGNALGFITAALFIDGIRERLGRAKAFALSQLIQAGGYVILCSTAPFPAIPLGFFLVGFGMSLYLAMGNVFCGSLRNGTTALGIMHGSYGIGGTIGPLIATALVTVAKTIWSRYYFITLALALANAGLALWAYWGEDNEQNTNTNTNTNTVVVGEQEQLEGRVAPTRNALAGMLTAATSRVVLLGALFIFAYQGAEVSISGWVISFLIAARNGDPSSVGYVTAGFWAGITLGRFLLSSPAHRIGEKKFVYWVVAGAAVFELLVWLVPNVVGDAVAVAIVGLLLGPVYPCAAAVTMRGMSKHERVTGVGVISAFGSSGGAAAPFTTGILAQAVGTFVLHPIAIFLFAVMLGCWYGLPNKPKRTD
ncbi:putative mfs efflux protein [Diplogelasinospora grovesii]|uniref:Mfs efflux protein n=1 Tax=Diplogelasinospora grovesii TaxID=303347 RepID=A0AAN6NDS7_9PEZI|nr:putative mfs efflux protein [Diplogelasinospora grovesii]